MLGMCKERAEELANNPKHLLRLMAFWPEEHIIHQLAKALKQSLEQTQIACIDEQAEFERWLASDYLPDGSQEASEEGEAVMRAIFWHVWEARAKLSTPQGDK